MQLIFSTGKINHDPCFGGKANNLFQLVNEGFSVPAFVVIPFPLSLQKEIQDKESNTEEIISAIKNYDIDAVIIGKIIENFKENTFFAVRSSATVEDGLERSYAGQFETKLFVPPEGLQDAIKSVWLSAFSERVSVYQNGSEKMLGIAVIIQEMIDADVAGVAFGINPLTGNTSEKIINAVYGLGEGLVSGELNADQYI